jgi:hypothetical protein
VSRLENFIEILGWRTCARCGVPETFSEREDHGASRVGDDPDEADLKHRGRLAIHSEVDTSSACEGRLAGVTFAFTASARRFVHPVQPQAITMSNSGGQVYHLVLKDMWHTSLAEHSPYHPPTYKEVRAAA